MKNQFKKFISSTVDYHNFKGALEIASELNCGIEISRFGRLKDIEDLFDVTKKEYKAALRDFEGERCRKRPFNPRSVGEKILPKLRACM